MTQPRPTLVLLAGPNGAGKSTFFELNLRSTGLRFVNADLIARVIAPDDPSGASYDAAKIAGEVRRLLVKDRESFCMETVFSDPKQDKLQFLLEARKRGYIVRIVFIGLASANLSQARVIERVDRGGHDVPDDKIFGRYPRTLANLRAAIPAVDSVSIYDNSDASEPFRLVAQVEDGRVVDKSEPLPQWLTGILPISE